MCVSLGLLRSAATVCVRGLGRVDKGGEEVGREAVEGQRHGSLVEDPSLSVSQASTAR